MTITVDPKTADLDEAFNAALEKYAYMRAIIKESGMSERDASMLFSYGYTAGKIAGYSEGLGVGRLSP